MRKVPVCKKDYIKAILVGVTLASPLMAATLMADRKETPPNPQSVNHSLFTADLR